MDETKEQNESDRSAHRADEAASKTVIAVEDVEERRLVELLQRLGTTPRMPEDLYATVL